LENPGLLPTCCAICHTTGDATELYPANFDTQAFNPVVFSARRLPDRIHYRLVKCNRCGLVRSDPIASSEMLAQLYQKSTFTYTEEVANLKQTYGFYLAELQKYGAQKGNLLEIGCGNGFFLEEALSQGYQNVQGVEPSQEAVLGAGSSVQQNIACDIMRPGLFKPEQFDVVCMFQVLDHIPDPEVLMKECFRVLKPGGLILCLNHNIESWSARLLKERSPIIDIEHTYLYSPASLSRLLETYGFIARHVGSVYNRYTLYYLARLIPLSTTVKSWVLNLLKRSFIGCMRASVPLGNLYIVAQKTDRIEQNK
jgi:SAM-dependent methyltransferase